MKVTLLKTSSYYSKKDAPAASAGEPSSARRFVGGMFGMIAGATGGGIVGKTISEKIEKNE